MRLKDELFASICYAIDPKNTTAPSVQMLAGQIIAIFSHLLAEQGQPESELSAKLAFGCDTPDVDLSWVFPIIANALVEHHVPKTMKLHFTNEWLKSRIEKDGDDFPETVP